MKLFDSHTHLYDAAFDADRDDVIGRARASGVARMLVLGEDIETSERAVALAGRQDGVYAAVGCHPHNAASFDEGSFARMAELARDERVVAIGEIGLDFYRDLSPRDAQTRVLQQQLDIAADAGKPVAVHCRDAHEAFLPVAEAWSAKLGGRLPDGRPLGVMHYFSADSEPARRYIELGFLISIHASVTYPKSERLREVARSLPIDALVVETDCPYGAPQSRRGKRNEPSYVIEAVQAIASLRGESIERVAGATTENACRVFGLDVASLGKTEASTRA